MFINKASIHIAFTKRRVIHHIQQEGDVSLQQKKYNTFYMVYGASNLMHLVTLHDDGDQFVTTSKG